MSMPPGFAEHLHRIDEQKASQVPYDPNVATKVVIKPKCEPQRTVVWEKNPWDVFERKVVLAYTGNKERIDLLKDEFARVGLTGVEVHWNCNDHFLNYLNGIPCVCFDPTNRAIANNAMGHYRIIKMTYELGYANCLIMEDDIRFLRDVNLMHDIITSMPSDYEVAMFDSHPLTKECQERAFSGEKVSKYWFRLVRRTSAACYAASRAGMEKLIALYEKEPLHASDTMFNDQNFKSIYFCHPLVARQVRIDGRRTNTNYDSWSQKYDIIGASREKYGK